jgi:N-acetylated-alpha-linked acidic dipeptidase
MDENEKSRDGKPSAASQPADVAPTPRIGDLGGGSDHVGFYCHVGVPSCYLSAGGAPGTAYHSNYDNLAWYRRTVGEDYEPALMLTRVVNVMAARLATASTPPLDPSRYARDLRTHITTLAERAEVRHVSVDLKALLEAVDRLEPAANRAVAEIAKALAEPQAAGPSAARQGRVIERSFGKVWRAWEPGWPAGLPGRPWFCNVYASSDPQAGYASWMLPAVRGAIERGEAEQAANAVAQAVEIVNSVVAALDGAASGPETPPAATGQGRPNDQAGGVSD